MPAKLASTLWVLGALLLTNSALAGSMIPETPRTLALPADSDREWFWISGTRLPQIADGQAYLFDEAGQPLGQLSTGFWFKNLINVPGRGEIVTLETHFAHTHRGKRDDVVAVYDDKTLFLKHEIEIPPKRLQAVKNAGLLRLSDDERFLLIVNYTPAQSVSVVDLESGEFVEEVETPGCSVVYTAGPRDFYSICGNGSFMHLRLDDTGHVLSRERSAPLFDAVDDFLTVSASRIGNAWYFVSRQNNVYAVKMDAETIEVVGKWPLTTDDERQEQWGIAGNNHTAAHVDSKELYVLMRQGEAHEFEQPGTHVWVYDAQTGAKLREIGLETDLGSLSIAVSQKDRPHLYSLDLHVPIPSLFTLWIYLTQGEEAVAEIVRQRASIYDAFSGDHVLNSRMVPRGGFVLNIQAW